MTILHQLPSLFGVSIEVYGILMVLGVSTFYICRWFLKKIIKVDDKKRKIATWAISLVATPFIYLGVMLLLFFAVSYHPTHDFDEALWFTDRERRYEVSEHIITSNMLIGKTKSEVRHIPGDESNADTSDYWHYYLGFRPGLANIDPDVLDIEFQDGKVIKVGQHKN